MGPGTHVGQAHTSHSGGSAGHRCPRPARGGLATLLAGKLAGGAGEHPPVRSRQSEAWKNCSWSGHKGPLRAAAAVPSAFFYSH